MRYFLFIFTCIFLLSSCFQSQTKVETAKDELLGRTVTPELTNPVQDKDTPVSQESDKKEGKEANIQIIALSTNQYLEFDDIAELETIDGEVEISGTTNPGIDSIRVLYSNPISSYPDDDYTLQAFSSGDTEFRYIASSRNQVLDYGQNEYIFIANGREGESKAKVIINIPNTKAEESGVEKQIVGSQENFSSLSLPTSSRYGEPVMLGEASFTYSQIKGFESKKESLKDVTCETLTEFLSERLNSWYYWNTCRDVVKDEAIRFNVIRLDGEEYIYERHYIDFKNALYSTYELERGEGVTSETIADKNNELKTREYPSNEIVDELIKDIVNS